MPRKRDIPKGKFYIGIDNGVTGSIGIIGPKGFTDFISAQNYTNKHRDYTKQIQNITRLDFLKFNAIIDKIAYYSTELHIIIERPMVNPGKSRASYSAVRCLEAMLIAIEMIDVEKTIEIIPSTDWSKILLPKGAKGKRLKTESIKLGMKLHPIYTNRFVNQGDADGMLIAEYCKRIYK